MVKKKQTTIDGLKIRTAKDAVPSVSAAKKTKKKTTKARKKSSYKKTTKPTSFDIKVTKRRATPEDVLVEDEITISEAEIKNESIENAHEDFLQPVEALDLEKMSKKELKAAKKAEKKEQKKQKKEKKKQVSKARKIITSILLAIVLLILGGLIYVLIRWNDLNALIEKITGGNSSLWDVLSTVMIEKYEPLKTDENGRTNILVFGTSGYSMDGDGNGGIHDGAQLTDSIMMISLDQDTGDVALVSLPRDLKGPSTCTATGKINEVYWCNNESGTNEKAGAEALEEAVSSILGVDFQYYAHLNWGALVEIVDSIGGIKVTLDEDISDYYWTGAVYEAGVEYELDGEEALGLARARHGTEMGDFTRGNSQQKILIAIKEKLMEDGISLGEVTSLLSALGGNLSTNFQAEDLKTGAHLLETLDFDNLRQLPLIDYDNGISLMTTTEIAGISYVIPSAGVGVYSAIRKYVQQNISSDPAEREGAKILVLNGTGREGVASDEKARLAEELKIKSAEIDDAPEGEYSNLYTLYATDEGKKPETKKILEEFYEQEAIDEEDLPDGISGYGWDFIIIVGNQQE